MIGVEIGSVELSPLRHVLGERLRERVLLARYTAARIGGAADGFFEARSINDLVEAARICWQEDIPLMVLGGGSNVLVSDQGVRGLVVMNRAQQIRFDKNVQPPNVWAESGANFGVIARQAALHGLSGLEWATGIPGTVGGAVVGNAGSHGHDVAGSIQMAEILHCIGAGKGSTVKREEWSVDELAYSYRESLLKRQPGNALVLTAKFGLEHSLPQITKKKVDEYAAYRRKTQPPGASMGSMFKNPPGDFAGRLIEASGLKGARVGNAMISDLHANFFINLGEATSDDVHRLIQIAHDTVLNQFDVNLELEIELVGVW